MPTPRVVVTLTTTPARMAHLGPTLQSLLRQDHRADEVIVYVPRRYRRPEFSSFTIPTMPAGVQVRVCDFDYGPATKVLPAVKEFAGKDVEIAYCDDDQVYDSGWLRRMLDLRAAHLEDCIAERGFLVAKVDARIKYDRIEYRLLKLASLGLWRPLKAYDTRQNDIVDLAMGFGGVLVRPEFFPTSVFEIPDVLWTVDDVWLSGQLAINGVKIRQSSTKRMSANSTSTGLASLLDSRIEGHDRAAANMACIEYFRRNHGIWAT